MKAKGFIPKTWDLRNLTDYKKRIIRRRAKDYPELIAHPEKFQSRKYSKEKAAKLLDAGYSGIGQHILMPYRGKGKEPFSSTLGQKVVGDKVIIDRGNRIETVYLNTGRDFLKTVERLIAKEEAMRENGEEYDKETYWAFKVGDNNTFLKLQGSLDGLMHYGQNLNLTDPNAKNFVHLVKVEYKDGYKAINQLPYDYNNPTELPKKPRRKPSNKRGK